MDNGSCPVGPDGYSDCNLTQALRDRAMERNKPVPRSRAWQSVLVKARKVQLLLLDVDGVLTDGTIIYTHDGGESKGFNTRDGFGLRMLQDGGVAVGVITARTSEAVSRRAKDLGFAHVYQGQRDKAAVYQEILAQTGLEQRQTAYMGDDLMDLPLLVRVGCSFAPADGVAEVRQRVDYTTAEKGGHGAVREVCDLLLEARGELAAIVERYAR